MITPRSYSLLHTTSTTAAASHSHSRSHSHSHSQTRRSSEKMGARSARQSTSQSIPDKSQVINTERRVPPSSATSTPPHEPNMPPTHSKPVVIPPRTPTKTSTQTQTVRARGHHGGRTMRSSSNNHRSDAIPPAVAALLAVTAIPPMPTRRRKGSSRDRRISMDELIQEWRQDDPDAAISVVGSPLDVLLGRVDELEDDEYGSLKSVEQEKDCISSRSISSESISTIPPSLDLDAPSFISNWDSISTPDSYRRPSPRDKVVQSPPVEDCVLDHPLLHFNQEECEQIANLDLSDIVTSPPASTDRFRSFKSNLTASFQALKSAAKSFSNFTAPSVPPDDLLTRSLLSPRFTSEMRPKQIQGTPSPALRRYMNPQPTPISPTELSMQLHNSIVLDADVDESAPMIQMQTYDRRGRSSSSRRRKNPDPFSEAGRAVTPVPAVRQREPRENSDFLRVIVLEMNMRRVGKLDARAVGKARIWLPPRKAGSGKPPALQSASGVPDRWAGVLAAGGE